MVARMVTIESAVLVKEIVFCYLTNMSIKCG